MHKHSRPVVSKCIWKAEVWLKLPRATEGEGRPGEGTSSVNPHTAIPLFSIYTYWGSVLVRVQDCTCSSGRFVQLVSNWNTTPFQWTSEHALVIWGNFKQGDIWAEKLARAKGENLVPVTSGSLSQPWHTQLCALGLWLQLLVLTVSHFKSGNSNSDTTAM